MGNFAQNNYELHCEENISKWILQKSVLSRIWINDLDDGSETMFVHFVHDTKLSTFVSEKGDGF